MGATTGIQWADSTWNPWRGCEKISPGCKNCYADTLSLRNPGTLGTWGSFKAGGRRIVAAETGPAGWAAPERWNADAAADGAPRYVFPSLCDPFEEWAGPMHNHRAEVMCKFPDGKWWANTTGDPAGAREVRLLDAGDVRSRLWKLVESTPNLIWLLLTKRPENVNKMVPGPWLESAQAGGRPWPRNLWLGTSVEHADYLPRVEELLKTPTPVPWMSAEPLLGSLHDLAPYLHPGRCTSVGPAPDYFRCGLHAGHNVGEFADNHTALVMSGSPWWGLGRGLAWVVVGGESGGHARPCALTWVRSIVDQCRTAAVPVFVKQLGGDPVEAVEVPPRRISLNHQKGGNPDEWPADLRIREMPPCLTS